MFRLNHIEEKRKNRKGAFLLILSAAAGILFILYGIPLLAQVTSTITDFKNTGAESGQVVQQDKTPPVAPRLNPLPEATKEKSITITGSAEAGSTLRVFKNDEKVKETLIDQTTAFSLPIDLDEGKNNIYVTATDQAGNESEKSQNYTVNYTTKPPEINITSPQDGQTFYSNSTITVTGTSTASQVMVNDRLAVIDSSGNFSAKITLSEGENTIKVKATDQAGNENEKDIKVTFTP